MEEFGTQRVNLTDLSLKGDLTCPACKANLQAEFFSLGSPEINYREVSPETSSHSGIPFFREVSPEINYREFSPKSSDSLSTVFRDLETDEEIYNRFGDIYKILGIDIYWREDGTFVEPKREQIVASYNLYKEKNKNLDTDTNKNALLFETLLDDSFRSGYNKYYLKYFKPEYAGTTRAATESVWARGGKSYKHFAKSYKKRKTARRKKGTKRRR